MEQPATERQYWNSTFQAARTRLHSLESTAPTTESKDVARELRLNWAYLTFNFRFPNPQRLHHDRFERYNSRVLVQLMRHAPIVIFGKHSKGAETHI